MSAEAPLVAIEGLRVWFKRPAGDVTAVDGVSLVLARGASLGVVGESGAGKSQLALAIPGLNPASAQIGGRVRFEGDDLIGASAEMLQRIRGARIGFVFQEPMTALTPHLTIGAQLAETIRAHQDLDRTAARAAALAMLERVHVPEPAARLAQYPHELSGGLRQRAMIAIALIAQPALLIADEPTSALDVTIQAGILALFRELKESLGTALLLISHDLAVVAAACDEVAVLYAGRIIEQGPAAALLRAPAHPYTAGLAAASLTLDTPLDAPLAVIPGSPPAAGPKAAGCAFRPRCPRAEARCAIETPALRPVPGGRVACHFPLGATIGAPGAGSGGGTR
jgi:oligopeptide/dipeptide ABC transporter ATP-binding protein